MCILLQFTSFQIIKKLPHEIIKLHWSYQECVEVKNQVQEKNDKLLISTRQMFYCYPIMSQGHWCIDAIKLNSDNAYLR